MLRFIAMQGVRAHENVEHSQHRENVIYRDRSRVLELLLQLENKQHIMHNNVKLDTIACIRYILEVCVM